MKPIREFDGKLLLAQGLSMEVLVAHLSFDISLLSNNDGSFSNHCESVFHACEIKYPWLKTKSLVCKPDQLIKRRGKNGLLGINLDWVHVQDWIKERAGKNVMVNNEGIILNLYP